jgi:hypothetical protein
MKRFFIPTIAVALTCTTVYSLTQGQRADAAPAKEHKVAICHGTASAKNPYVLIIVDESAKAAHLAGHGKNSAPDYVLDKGAILTPERIEHYRNMDDATACGAGPGTGNS